MPSEYQARWISKARAEHVKRTGQLGHALLLDTYNGFLIIEPVGSDIGDGAVLSPLEASYELQEVWFTGPKSKLREARRRIGLEHETTARKQLSASGA